ncbi:hypothetical protein D3C77_546640 [compost metagenome]
MSTPFSPSTRKNIRFRPTARSVRIWSSATRPGYSRFPSDTALAAGPSTPKPAPRKSACAASGATNWRPFKQRVPITTRRWITPRLIAMAMGSSNTRRSSSVATGSSTACTGRKRKASKKARSDRCSVMPRRVTTGTAITIASSLPRALRRRAAPMTTRSAIA